MPKLEMSNNGTLKTDKTDLKGKILANRQEVKFLKKNYKKLFGYAIVMVVCVFIIVLMACLSENRLEGYENEYEQSILATQKQIDVLEEKIVNLTNENLELKKQLEKNSVLESDLVTFQQALSDMRDIFEMYKTGNLSSAKKAYEKIEPIGFDDSTLAYFELLGELLKK